MCLINKSDVIWLFQLQPRHHNQVNQKYSWPLLEVTSVSLLKVENLGLTHFMSLAVILTTSCQIRPCNAWKMLLYQKQEALSAKIFIWSFILSEAHSYLWSLKGSYSFFHSENEMTITLAISTHIHIMFFEWELHFFLKTQLWEKGERSGGCLV